ncbi:hypothetical protein FRACA_1350002 [Frankia canadensis]|uniref:Uncharacterized protein n=1 Tax=Frankia canadensis TaxID=1836972 RepID=A0A2I2KKW1_9ACTN|nr:hypothetical protein FRACA_1350002 [Frankia canadensis]SOU53602.1 hypothetical protein FRACA_1350002 [Frankia canadensis]
MATDSIWIMVWIVRVERSALTVRIASRRVAIDQPPERHG